MSNNANFIFGNIIPYFREKYRLQHDFSKLNKAIKQIEHAPVLSGDEQSLIDRVWSLILVFFLAIYSSHSAVGKRVGLGNFECAG